MRHSRLITLAYYYKVSLCTTFNRVPELQCWIKAGNATIYSGVVRKSAMTSNEKRTSLSESPHQLYDKDDLACDNPQISKNENDTQQLSKRALKKVSFTLFLYRPIKYNAYI